MQELVQARVERLEAVFRDIAATRMVGVPLLHPGLQVQAVGFAPEPEGSSALGVLVTPWFMNLLRLPLAGAGEPPAHRCAPAQFHWRARGGVWPLCDVLAGFSHVRICGPGCGRGHGP